MAFNDRAAEHKVVKMTKHFIGVSDSDADSFGQDGHNPGNLSINFLNPNLTNISSSSDATKTIMNPLSLQFDVTYSNVSEAFRNNKFRIRSMAGNLLARTINGNEVRENGSNPSNAPAQYDPKSFPVVTIKDGIYKTGADLSAAIVEGIAGVSGLKWFGGNALNFANTTYDANSQSIRFKYSGAAPAGTPELFIDSVFQDPVTNIAYDSSRVLGTTGAEVGPVGHVLYTDGAFKLPYATTQGAAPVGVTTPAFVDLQTIDVIQLRSNCAKRYYRKQGTNGVAGLNPLSFIPVLFEIPLDTAIGGSFYWQPQDNRYSQEINSNFETMTLQITDKFGRVVPFSNNAEMNYQFVIEREIIVPSNEERVKAMSEYNRFKSF
jgi:hypothetical protein